MALTENGYAASCGSFNKHIIKGVRVNQYFSPRQIVIELMKHNDILRFDEEENILIQANQVLESNEAIKKKIVYDIIYDFGYRLAEILYLLQKPTKEQKANRNDWNEDDWKYMKRVKRVYLAGGLLTPHFKVIFEQAIADFHKKKLFHKDIILIEKSENLALFGLSSKSRTDCLVYDFGQTGVKSGSYQNQYLNINKTHDVIINQSDDLKEYGNSCHNFIKNIIVKDLKDHSSITNVEIALSNYVKNGVIDEAPWHYGVLYYVEPDYESFLQRELTETLGRRVYVKLHHDTTSMGYAMKHKKKSVLISLGTAFGITYFDLQKEHNTI